MTKDGWGSKKIFSKISLKFLSYNSHVALLFLKLQIAVLYLNAGISKLFALEWSNGTAVYYWFNDVVFGAPNWLRNSFIEHFFINPVSVSIINWGVIVLELFLFVGLFLKQEYKYLLFVIASLFHFTIFIVHGLATFGVSMAAALIIYLFRTEISIKENIHMIKRLISKTLKNEKYLYRKIKIS